MRAKSATLKSRNTRGFGNRKLSTSIASLGIIFTLLSSFVIVLGLDSNNRIKQTPKAYETISYGDDIQINISDNTNSNKCDFSQIQYRDLGGIVPCYKTASFTCPDGREFRNMIGPREEGGCPTKSRWQAIYMNKCGCTLENPNDPPHPSTVVVPTVSNNCAFSDEGHCRLDSDKCIFLECANAGEGRCIDKPVAPNPTIDPSHYCSMDPCLDTKDEKECRKNYQCDLRKCPFIRPPLYICTKDAVLKVCPSVTPRMN